MAKPSEKTNLMEKLLEQMCGDIFGVSRKATIEGNVCVSCGGGATEFEDETSEREYGISGFCQTCQNDVFNGEEY